MKSILKAGISGICGLLISAAFFAGELRAVAVSTSDIKTDLDAAQVLSQDLGPGANKAVQDYVFDGNTNGGTGSLGKRGVVSLNPSVNTTANAVKNTQTASVKSLKGEVPPLTADEQLSNKPGVKQKSLDGLTVSPDGNMYKVTKESSWWKFWDSNRSIQKAVPDTEGNMWNAKGEYVGGWKTVMQTKIAGDLQVVKGADGNDHFYTQKGGWGSQEVYRDGRYVTTFSNSIVRDASLSQVKAGADDKVYAKYSKTSEDIIMSVDPVTKKQTMAARVPAEVRVWTEIHTRQVFTPTDNQGNGYYRTELYTQQHMDRKGVDKFNVTGDGRVFTLFKGNVFEEGQRGGRELIAGNKRYYNPLDDVPYGNISDFKVDSFGNLYSAQSGRVVVNNNPLSSADIGWQDLRVDNSGNVYKTNIRGAWGNLYLIRDNILPDPANGDRIAAPDAGHPASRQAPGVS